MAVRASALRRAIRYLLKFSGSVLLRLLTRTTVVGADTIPRRGPFIVAGNHRAVMEIFLMLVATRPQVDIIGAGDIPLDPAFRSLAHAYGYIPYRRGSVDGAALRRALRVLESGGVVGIFPEGGIWTEGPKETQRGVAWLAAQTGAPVVPMGFGGIDRGVERLMRLDVPRFEVRVGDQVSMAPGEVTRGSLDRFSNLVMSRIDALVPAWDRASRPRPARDEYTLVLRWGAAEAHELVRSDERAVALARFLHLPVLLSIFTVNLRRDVGALAAWDEPRQGRDVRLAAQRILGYLRLRNRHLLTYRLGTRVGGLVEEGLRELRDWCGEREHEPVTIVPVRRITWPDGRVEERRRPG